MAVAGVLQLAFVAVRCSAVFHALFLHNQLSAYMPGAPHRCGCLGGCLCWALFADVALSTAAFVWAIVCVGSFSLLLP